MDKPTTDEITLVENYVMGHLSAAELDAFEARLLWDADLRREVDLVEALRDGLSAVEQTQVRPFPAARQRVFALAASVLLLIGGWVGGSRFGTQNGAAPLASTMVYYLEATRGGPQESASGVDANRIVVTAADQWITLIVYPAMLDYEDFVVVVGRTSDDGEPTVWREDGLKPRSDSIAVNLPVEILKEGRYRLRVLGRQVGVNGAFQEAANAPFNVVRGST